MRNHDPDDLLAQLAEMFEGTDGELRALIMAAEWGREVTDSRIAAFERAARRFARMGASCAVAATNLRRTQKP